MHEAQIVETGTGKLAQGDGWFVLNVAEASWERIDAMGTWCSFQAPDAPFEHYGIGVHVLMPGQPNGRYHGESEQEGFLVLAGECLAIVEGEERHLRRWDYLHCPPWTEHIMVGAGDGPCAILMTGARRSGAQTHYPVEPLAEPYGGSTRSPTDRSKEAYADVDRTVTRVPAPWP